MIENCELIVLKKCISLKNKLMFIIGKFNYIRETRYSFGPRDQLPALDSSYFQRGAPSTLVTIATYSLDAAKMQL